MSAPPRVLRGRALFPRADFPRVDLVADAVIEIDANGRIVSAGPAPSDCTLAETHPHTVLSPGFVDCHLHFPQTRVIGSASGPLLTWLERSVFPEEARFASLRYASAVAHQFCEAMIAQGTTCAAIYSSSHPSAADVLFSELDRRGLRALAGITLMDRGAPTELLLEASAALDACTRLIERWHDHDAGRLRVSIVPRFALSCSPELLRGAADLAASRGLWIQTHISENHEELRATAAAFPTARDYLGVYEDHGLVGAHTIFAHGIWLSDHEWDRLADQRSVIAHCPDSNFFLGSGCMPLRAATSRGIAIGLGTDVGAGRTFSLRRVAASAYDASLVVGEPASSEELLWLATTGGARAIGLGETIGRIAPGFEGDLIAIPAPDGDLGPAALFDSLVFRHDAGPVAATYVRGRRL